MAVAGLAGVNLHLGAEYDYGVDGSFRRMMFRGTKRVDTGLLLDFQLKSTIDWAVDGGDIVYALRSKNYNDLVTREPDAVGAILLLLCLPAEQPPHWLEISEDQLVLRHCCYWASLVGDPVPNEDSTKTIRIPRGNVFNSAELLRLLELERDRRLGGAL